MTNQEIFKWAVSVFAPVFVPSVAGFLGVLIGAWLTTKREIRQRRHEFVERQLSDFYSPLLGCHMKIEAICVTHRRIEHAANEAWRKSCNEMSQTARREENLERLNTERGPAFARIADGDNKQLGERVNAAYRNMVRIFEENLWLAQPGTRGYFGGLLEYADLSERCAAQEIPHEVLRELDYSEHSLLPFFKHIQETHDLLRGQVSRGGY
jgi:hypothetical protein